MQQASFKNTTSAISVIGEALACLVLVAGGSVLVALSTLA